MPFIAYPALITPLGDLPATFFAALLEGHRAFSGPLHFPSHGRRMGVCHQIDAHEEFDERYSPEERQSFPRQAPRTHRLLEALRAKLPATLPPRLYLATTVGDIDLVTNGECPAESDSPRALLAFAKELFGSSEALLVSSACASGQRAICLAADAVARGEIPAALVVGCDQCSEFVTSGFASLNALSPELPKPYDVERRGMTLGEAAAAVIVTSEKPSSGWCASICGYGESCDAAHITAPDATGTWLAAAIRAALPDGVRPDAIIGHGTGTLYNDQAEIQALKEVFPNDKLPLFSLKGNIGHTLGATGVLQTIAAMGILATSFFPPQAVLETPAPGAEDAVSATRRKLPLPTRTVLSLNAGFGGLNNALLLGLPTTSNEKPGQNCTLALPCPIASALDETPENLLGTERDKLVENGLLSATEAGDFRRASLAVKHAILAAARLKEKAGGQWETQEITLIGTAGDGVRFSNPAYWQDYVTHGSRRGRGTLFVDTLASIPLCEVAIALQLHGPAGYLDGLPLETLLKTVKTKYALVLSAGQASARAELYAYNS